MTEGKSGEALRLVRSLLEARLAGDSARWLAQASGEVAAGCDDGAFCALISKASRYLPRGPLEPSASECAAAGELFAGWNPERWTTLETGRVALVLAHPGAADERVEQALEEAFRYSEVGEQCALYRSLALLPDPARFAWRAGEGARSNMRSVFEAVCCDTPYPARYFGDVAWRSAVVKCLFVEGPLWRVHGLDGRLGAELAHVALDLADERRSAGRRVNPELWMCLGQSGGPRGLEALELELQGTFQRGRAGAALALARAGELERLGSLAAVEADPWVQGVMAAALEGASDQRAFRVLDPDLARTI